MQLNKIKMGVGTVFALLLVSASVVKAAGNDGEFWNTGVHYQMTGKIVPMAEDGIHDPENEAAISTKQHPAEALKDFPRDAAGLTDWTQALFKGHINPRSDILGERPDMKGFDLNIDFTQTAPLPKVTFAHKPHTALLTCKECHPAIFKQKKGANQFKMADILAGQACGVCHGKVAFAPAKHCKRCHVAAE